MEGATAIARQPKLVTLFKCIETQKDRYVERENQQNQTTNRKQKILTCQQEVWAQKEIP